MLQEYKNKIKEEEKSKIYIGNLKIINKQKCGHKEIRNKYGTAQGIFNNMQICTKEYHSRATRSLKHLNQTHTHIYTPHWTHASWWDGRLFAITIALQASYTSRNATCTLRIRRVAPHNSRRAGKQLLLWCHLLSLTCKKFLLPHLTRSLHFPADVTHSPTFASCTLHYQAA